MPYFRKIYKPKIYILIMIKSFNIYENLKKYAVFDTKILNYFLNKSQSYANLFRYRLKKNFKLFKIEKNKYTVYNNPFLIASRIIWPSYMSCWSALSFYKMTEQIPQTIQVITVKNKKPIKFLYTKIQFIKIKRENFFGFEKINYDNFEVFIADKEKTLIDCLLLKEASFSEIRDILNENIKILNVNRIIRYLKIINNSSLTKRLGFLLENLGYNAHKRLKDYIDPIYTLLNYSKPVKGKKNEKWRLMLND